MLNSFKGNLTGFDKPQLPVFRGVRGQVTMQYRQHFSWRDLVNKHGGAEQL